MPTIEFQGVCVSFEDKEILSDINLTLSEHRIGIIGANGGGKSTLTRLINGLGEPTTGTVLVDAVDVAKSGKEVRRKVGFVFSDAENQIVMPNVRDDVAFSLRRLKLAKEEKKARVDAALEKIRALTSSGAITTHAVRWSETIACAGGCTSHGPVAHHRRRADNLARPTQP